MLSNKTVLLAFVMIIILCTPSVAATQVLLTNKEQNIIITDNDYTIEKEFHHDDEKVEYYDTYSGLLIGRSNIDGDILYYSNVIDKKVHLVDLTSNEEIENFVMNSDLRYGNLGFYGGGGVEVKPYSLKYPKYGLNSAILLLDIISFQREITTYNFSVQDIFPSEMLDILNSTDADIEFKKSILIGSELVISYRVLSESLVGGGFANVLLIFDLETVSLKFSHALGPVSAQEGFQKYCPKYRETQEESLNYNPVESTVLLYTDKDYCYIDVENSSMLPGNFTEPLDLLSYEYQIYYHDSSMISYLSTSDEMIHHYYNSDRSPTSEVIDVGFSLDKVFQILPFDQGFVFNELVGGAIEPASPFWWLTFESSGMILGFVALMFVNLVYRVKFK